MKRLEQQDPRTTDPRRCPARLPWQRPTAHVPHLEPARTLRRVAGEPRSRPTRPVRSSSSATTRGLSTPTSVPSGAHGDRRPLNFPTIGGTNTVWYYRNLPAVAEKAGATSNDAVPSAEAHPCHRGHRHSPSSPGVPRMLLVGQHALRGSLCTSRCRRRWLHSRWRPPFLSALAPEDNRRHLNGLCLVDCWPRPADGGSTSAAAGS